MGLFTYTAYMWQGGTIGLESRPYPEQRDVTQNLQLYDFSPSPSYSSCISCFPSF